MKKSKLNLVVGAEVLIDWPIRWKGADEQFQQRCRDEAQAKESHFGCHGVVMGYNPGQERGNEYTVLLNDGPHKGELVDLFYGALTVEAMPPRDETDKLLLAILNKLEEIDQRIANETA